MILKKSLLLGYLGLTLGLSASVHAQDIVCSTNQNKSAPSSKFFKQVSFMNNTGHTLVLEQKGWYQGFPVSFPTVTIPKGQRIVRELGCVFQQGHHKVTSLRFKVRQKPAISQQSLTALFNPLTMFGGTLSRTSNSLPLSVNTVIDSSPHGSILRFTFLPPLSPLLPPLSPLLPSKLISQVSFMNNTGHDLVLEETGRNSSGPVFFPTVTIPKGQRSVRGIGWPLQQGHQATSLRFKVRQKTGSPQQAWVVRLRDIDTYGGYISRILNTLLLSVSTVLDSGPMGSVAKFTFSPRP